MKSYTNKAFIVIVLCTFFTAPQLYGQSNTITEADLIGEWKLNYSSSFNQSNGQNKQRFENEGADYKARVKAGLDGRIIRFKSNNEYEIQNPDGSLLKFTWQLNEASDGFVIQLPTGVTRTYRVKTVNSNKLIFEMEDAQRKQQSLLSKMHYSKL